MALSLFCIEVPAEGWQNISSTFNGLRQLAMALPIFTQQAKAASSNLGFVPVVTFGCTRTWYVDRRTIRSTIGLEHAKRGLDLHRPPLHFQARWSVPPGSRYRCMGGHG